jgi:carbohydrate kinase (thermoresistant glucokinase family)
MIYVIMGVCGCGKSLIGKMLADKLGISFYEGDDFHPQSNVRKMRSGKALNDDDRKPWLEIMATQMQEWQEKGGVVLSCSALKKKYRDILRKNNEVRFVYLKGTPELIEQRMQSRKKHFMSLKLIRSQFDTLEEPDNAITADIDDTPERILENIIKQLEIH